MRKHLWTLSILLLTSLILMSGCVQREGSQVSKDQNVSSGSDQKGYLFSGSGSVMFIRWTNVDKKLNGQLQVFYSQGNGERQPKSFTSSFEGMSDGQNISINFTGSIWTNGLSGQTWTGTLKDNELTLVMPAKNGILIPIKLKLSTVEDYNKTVSDLKQNIRAGNLQRQKEGSELAQKVSEQQTISEARAEVGTAINRLINATKALRENERFDDVMKAYAEDWERTQADFNEMKDKASGKSLSSYQLGQVKYALGKVEYDLGRTKYNSGSMEYKINSLNERIKISREGIVALRKSWGTLQQAVAVNTSFLSDTVTCSPY